MSEYLRRSFYRTYTVEQVKEDLREKWSLFNSCGAMSEFEYYKEDMSEVNNIIRS